MLVCAKYTLVNIHINTYLLSIDTTHNNCISISYLNTFYPHLLRGKKKELQLGNICSATTKRTTDKIDLWYYKYMYIQTYYIVLGEDVSEIIKKNSQEFAS